MSHRESGRPEGGPQMSRSDAMRVFFILTSGVLDPRAIGSARTLCRRRQRQSGNPANTERPRENPHALSPSSRSQDGLSNPGRMRVRLDGLFSSPKCSDADHSKIHRVRRVLRARCNSRFSAFRLGHWLGRRYVAWSVFCRCIGAKSESPARGTRKH